jgi:hypothetical protein
LLVVVGTRAAVTHNRYLHDTSLSLGNEETPIERYAQLAGKNIVDAKYNMHELVN